MIKRGTMKYIPPPIIIEMEEIKNENSIQKDAEALREMANYSKVGREVERIMRFGFPKKRRGFP